MINLMEMILTQSHQLLIPIIWNEVFEAIQYKLVAVDYVLPTDIAIPAEHAVNRRFHTLTQNRGKGLIYKLQNQTLPTNGCKWRQNANGFQFKE